MVSSHGVMYPSASYYTPEPLPEDWIALFPRNLVASPAAASVAVYFIFESHLCSL